MEEQIAQLQREVNELKAYVNDRKIQQLTFPLDEVTKKIIGDDESGISNGIVLGTGSEVTISSGEITPTEGYHTVDTEGDAASDDLTNIDVTGITDGTLLLLRAADAGRTVVLVDGGNLRLAGNFSLDHSRDTILLIKGGAVWYEVSRSDNDS